MRFVVTSALQGRQIMERNFHATRLPQMQNEHTMTLINDRGRERVRKLVAVSKLQANGLDSRLLVRFEFPGDVRGTEFLQVQHHDGEDDLWVYLPGLRKVRRLVAGNKKDSFFGSEFSFGDLLLPVVDTFRHKLLRREPVEGAPCFVVESVPAADRIAGEYGFAKKISWVLEANFHERRIEYHDGQGRLLKVQDALEVRQVQEKPPRWWAMRREMRNEQTGYRTRILFDRLDVRTSVEDERFNPRSLGRG